MVAYAVGFIVGILTRVYSAISPAFLQLFNHLTIGFSGAFQMITGVLTGFLSLFTGMFKIIVSILKGDFPGALLAAKAMVRGVVSGMVSAFNGLWIYLKGMLGMLVSGFKLAFLGIWIIAQTTITAIWGVIRNIISFFGQAIAWLVTGLISFGQSIFQALTGPFQKARDFIWNIFSNIGDLLSVAFSGVTNVASNLWTQVKSIFLSGFNWLGGKVNGMLKAVNKVSGLVGIPALPEIPQFATGIKEVPSDMLAVIHRGEAVLPAKQNPFNSEHSPKNIFNTSKSEQSTHIDSSIHVAGITIQVTGGSPEDFKSKLLEVFEELAQKNERLGVSFS